MAVVSVAEEVEELRRRIALLDGDKKAYSETSQYAIKMKKDLIKKLREENKNLRAKLSRKMEADDDVVVQVFDSHGCKTPAELRGLTGESAVCKFDYSVSELINRRNALQHVKQSREKMLSSLEMQLDQMQQDTQFTVATPAGDSEDSQQLRQLENRLDKAIIKNNEARHIRKTYEAILQKLQEERLGFDNDIAALEKAIKKRRKDLRELESMLNDAQLSRDMAKGELGKLEQSISEDRRKREKKLSKYRQQVEEKKEFQEKVERRLRRMSVQPGSTGPLGSSVDAIQEDQEAKIASYEEALAKIKDATGVSDIQEVVDRFLTQGDTKRHLEQLREENTHHLAQLKEEKERLQAQFEEMKYSGEAKMSTGQRMLEEFEEHLDEAKRKCRESEMKADRSLRLLAQVKNGVNHLSEKLQHIKAPQMHVLKPKLSPDSEEYVLEQLSVAEQKLVGVAEELASRDQDTIRKEMEDEEFRHTVEGGVAGNVMVELPQAGSATTFYDEDSGSDEEMLTREAMKKTTALLVEAKTKKKPQDDEEEEEGRGRKRKRR